ncbi:BTAD domain-containing putative transcriptional regulator [Streptosporangium carneum]|uniref:BTAD domain-containing putative transcriptional regulator n=1 Tax=Streptosporangium carneum TaxID=47481 RepID=UPI0031EF794B
MDTGLTFRLFGACEAADAAGRPLDLGARKQRAVLAMLALEPGRVVPLDRLIDELWAGEAPSGATGTLQAYISHLRRVLEPERRPRTPPRILLTREPGYLLAVAPGQVDLTRFTAWAEDGGRALARGEHGEARRVLDRALALWRGNPLEEFTGLEFAQPVTARLAEVRVAAVEDRFEALLALGEGAACVPDLESLVEEHPYRERSWGLLVLALYRVGRQADALGALRRARERLAEDLGIEPGPQLRRLEEAVFGQAPELEIPAAPVAARPVEPAVSEKLVARDAQLRLVRERLTGVRRGDGGVLLVTGEAGIGKTRLAQAAAEEAAARGFRVAWGRCLDDTAPAFWPWIQVLRECGDGAGPLSGEAPGHGRDPDVALFELYESVVSALTGTGGPLMVILDDLHWADVSSLRLLGFVAGELARHPVLVVATLRPEPGEHPEQLRDTLGALSRERATERIELTPFDADDVSSYLRLRLVAESPELVGALLERSGGNPFYLGELLRLRESEQGLSSALPPGARDVIARRVARLPEQTREVLGIASAAIRDVEVDLLAAVTATPVEEVMSLLEPAVATGLLSEVPDGFDYRFSHALVRDALYSGLGRLARARLHLRIALCLEALPGVEPVRLARHFAAASKAGGAAKAVEHARRAARHASARLAYAEAVELWELALSCLPPGDEAGRCAVLTGLGQARRTVGNAEEAFRDLEEAIGLALRTGDRAALVSAITVFGGLTVWNWRPYGVVDEGMVTVLEDLLAGPLDEADRAALLGTLGMELYYGSRRAEGERHAAEAVEVARGLGDPGLLARTLNNYLLVSWTPGRNAERLDAAGEMLAVPGLPRAAQLVARVLRMACLLRTGDLAGWDRDLARCERLLDEVRRPELEAMVRIAETARCTLDGRWADAEALLSLFGDVRYGSSLWQGAEFRRLVTTFTCEWGRGRGAGLARLADELVAAAEQPAMLPLRPVAVLAAMEAGRGDLARELTGRWGAEVGEDWIADFLVPVWGLVSAGLGVPDPGPLYERLLPYADQLIVAGTGCAAWGCVHHVLAGLASRLGRTAAAREHARAAAGRHRELGLAHWEERSLALLGDLEAGRAAGSPPPGDVVTELLPFSPTKSVK